MKVEEPESPEQLKLPPMEMVSRSLESLGQFDKQMDVINAIVKPNDNDLFIISFLILPAPITEIKR